VNGLPVAGLWFMPVGFAAACSVVDIAGGERRLLDLWADTCGGGAGADWRAAGYNEDEWRASEPGRQQPAAHTLVRFVGDNLSLAV
jgi:hypothetical protein